MHVDQETWLKWPIEQIRLVGVVTEGRRKLAWVQRQNEVQTVKVGDYLGIEPLKITAISDKGLTYQGQGVCQSKTLRGRLIGMCSREVSMILRFIIFHCAFGVAAILNFACEATQIQNETLVRLYLNEPVPMPKLELDKQQTQLKFKLKAKPANWVLQEQVFDLDWIHGWHWQQLDGVSELTFALKAKSNVEASLFKDGLQLRFYKQLQEANVLNQPNQSNAILETGKPKQPISLRLLDAPVQEVLYTRVDWEESREQ